MSKRTPYRSRRSDQTSRFQPPKQRLGLVAAAALAGFVAVVGAVGPAAGGTKPIKNIQRSGPNIALHHPVTFEEGTFRPKFGGTKDADDDKQLTDGKYAAGKGPMWRHKSAVGWHKSRPALIKIDLGKDQPIAGVSLHTAKGGWGFGFPKRVLIMVSDDGKTWREAGDLMKLDKAAHHAKPKGNEHRFWTGDLHTHGRHVAFLVDPGGRPLHSVADEIEVYGGPDSLMSKKPSGPKTDDLIQYFFNVVTKAAARLRIDSDLSSVEKLINASKGGMSTRQRLSLLHDAKALHEQLKQADLSSVTDGRSILPLTPLHAKVFALRGKVLRARGKRGLVARPTNPWDLPELVAVSDAGNSGKSGGTVHVAAMRGETRAGAVNLTNAMDHDAQVRVAPSFPGHAGKDLAIIVRNVLWTTTMDHHPVAGALPRAKNDGEGYQVTIPAGMTGQVWLQVKPGKNAAPGTHQGQLRLTLADGGKQQIPLDVRVFDMDFPAQPAMHVSGWDYTNKDSIWGVSPDNRKAIIKHLKARDVDTTWATKKTVGFGGADEQDKMTFDDQGRMTRKPDTTNFDQWVARWPGARRYAITVGVNDTLGQFHTGTPAFKQAVRTWVRFWADHAKSQGLKPDQILLLLKDEPNNPKKARLSLAWAEPIQAAHTGVKLYVDATPRLPDMKPVLQKALAASDVICPNLMHYRGKGSRGTWEQAKKAFDKLRQSGKELQLYECATGPNGEARMFDPYAYNRLMAWYAYDMGADGMNLWSFIRKGDASDWTPMLKRDPGYVPYFLGKKTATAGKHMEAMREGVEDFQYLVMLRDKLAKLKAADAGGSVIDKAEALLKSAPRQVIDAAGADKTLWTQPTDRSVADRMRERIGQVLEKLDHLPAMTAAQSAR